MSPQKQTISSTSFYAQTIDLIQSQNVFDGRKAKALNWSGKSFKSIFSDYEAALICGGLTEQNLHSTVRKFHKNEADKDLILKLHFYAVQAYIKYGGPALTWIITLPKLPFKVFNATPIFSELDKRRKKVNFPIIRLLFSNQYGNDQRLQISFFSEQTESGKLINNGIINVKNQTTGQFIMTINRNGFVTPAATAKGIIPILQLFIRFCKNTQKMIINYGLETGECSICGRELTTSESIKRGIGPVCMQY